MGYVKCVVQDRLASQWQRKVSGIKSMISLVRALFNMPYYLNFCSRHRYLQWFHSLTPYISLSIPFSLWIIKHNTNCIVITKYHRLDGLKNSSCFLTVLETGKSKTNCWSIQFSSDSLFPGLQIVPSHCIFIWWREESLAFSF